MKDIMSHLTDEQLIELFYDEPETVEQETDWRSHLESCQHCSARLESLQRVGSRLDDSVIAAPALSVDVDAMLVGEEVSSNSNKSNFQSHVWLRWAMAASILALVSFGGFAIGRGYESSRLSEKIDRAISMKLSHSRVNDRAEWDASEAISKMESRIVTRLEQSIVKGSSESPNSIPSLERIESYFQKLALEQQMLRKDLQALALTAESEIRSTKAQVSRTNEALWQLHEMAGLNQ